MPIREQEDALFEEWERAIDRPFYPDGAVNEEAFADSEPKLLYVLKEPNDPEGGGFDLREFVRNGGQARYVEQRHALDRVHPCTPSRRALGTTRADHGEAEKRRVAEHRLHES